MIEIIKYEMEKIRQNKTFIGALIVSLFVILGLLYIGFYQAQLHGTNRDGLALYQKNVQAYTGELSEQKINTVLADYIDQYQTTSADQRTFDLFSWEIANTFFQDGVEPYEVLNEAIAQGETITINQFKLKTIDEVGFSSFSTPLRFGSYVTWYDLFKLMGQLFILTSVLVILVCSLVFSNDTSRNMYPLLLSTKFGRNKLTIAKLIAISFISIMIFIGVQLILLIAFYIYNSGFTGWDTSIQTNFSLKHFNFPVEINQLQLFLLTILLHFAGILAIIGLTTFTSSVTLSPFSALAISLGLLFLPAALTELIKKGVIYQILNIFPINHYQVDDFLTLMTFKSEYLLDSFEQNIILTIIVLFLIKMILDYVVYRRMKHYQI